MNKGLIFDIRRFTVHDGPGIRTTVFFMGCPLNCWWCHNPESHRMMPEISLRTLELEGKKYKRKETTGRWVTVEEVIEEVIKDRVFYEESNGGVTFSGGEPLVQYEFLRQLLVACKQNNFHTAIDTTGYITTAKIRHLAKITDLFLYDIKLMDDAEHRKYTGVSNELILKNLAILLNEGSNVIIRIPVVPGITDTRKNTDALKEFLEPYKEAVREINLLPYHTIAKHKYSRFSRTNKMGTMPDLKPEEAFPMKQELETLGIGVKIGG